MVYLLVRHARLAFMWTLTYEPKPGCPEGRTTRAQVFEDLRRFYEDIQARYGRMPLLAVVERGAKKGRLHVHFATNRWLAHSLVKTLWGHGFVHVGDPGKLPGNPGAEQLAGYLAKYIAKELEAGDLAPEEHSYSRTRGWGPPPWRRRFHTEAEGRAWLARVIGLAVREGRFGDPAEGPVYGRWLIFGDGELWAPWDDW